MSDFSGAYNPQFLRDISLAWLNEQGSFINTKVAPEVPVQKDSAKIVSYGADSIRVVPTIRAVKGKPNTVELSVSNATHYNLEDHALSDYIPYEDYDNAEAPVKPQEDATEHLTELLTVAKEYAMATAVQATSTYTSSNYVTNSGGDVWNDYDNSDPIAQLMTGFTTVRGNCMHMPDTLILAFDSWVQLLDHPRIKDRLGSGVDVTPERLNMVIQKAIPSVKQVLIGQAQYNSANKGATVSIGDIWTKSAILCYSGFGQSNLLKKRVFYRTYAKSDRRMLVDIVKKSKTNVDLTARNSDYIQVADKYDQVLVDQKCAYLIETHA